jgi:hypothetical protein
MEYLLGTNTPAYLTIATKTDKNRITLCERKYLIMEYFLGTNTLAYFDKATMVKKKLIILTARAGLSTVYDLTPYNKEYLTGAYL